jgi:NitT/TauT family transport system substrate-binding protein
MTNTTRRKFRAAVALCVAVPMAAMVTAPTAVAQDAESTACVPADPAVPVSFQLNFTAGGYNAPFALAELEGYYDDVGLNVDIVKGQGSGTTARLVASGQAGLAYADASATAQVIAQGAPIKILSTIYQSSPNAINALADSGIESVADLAGKRLGEPTGEAGSALLGLLLEANGLTRDDLEIVPMPGTSLVGALTQDQVDAILGSTEGYNLVLEEQGFDVTVLPYAEWGVPTVSTSIIASDRFLEENANTVRCFVEASLKGWDEAIKRPDDAIAALVEYFPYDTRAELNKRQLESAIDLVCANGAQFVGKAEPEAWEASVKIWQDFFGLSPDVPATEYYTYDYLPETLPTSCPLPEMAE